MAGIAQRLGQELPHRGIVFGKKDLRHDPVVRSLVPRSPAAPRGAGPHPPRGEPRRIAPGSWQYRLQAKPQVDLNGSLQWKPAMEACKGRRARGDSGMSAEERRVGKEGVGTGRYRW